jgi:hypothetical protein
MVAPVTADKAIVTTPGNDDAPAPPAAAPEQVNAAAVGQELLRQLDAFGAMPTMNAAELENFLQRLLTMSGATAKLSSMQVLDGTAAGNDEAAACEDRLLGPEHEFWLLQIRQINAQSQQFLEADGTLPIERSRLHGVILSLLNCDGDDVAVMEKIATWCQNLNLPLVVLVDQTTSGQAELLSAKLQQQGAFLLGEKMPGKNGKTHLVTLSTGQQLRLTPANLTSESSENAPQVLPDLLLTKNVRQKPGEIPSEWLRQAVDFLIIKNALDPAP